MYTEGNSEGALFDGDGSLVIDEGIRMNKLFEQMTGNGQYSGGIGMYYCSKKMRFDVSNLLLGTDF